MLLRSAALTLLLLAGVRRNPLTRPTPGSSANRRIGWGHRRGRSNALPLDELPIQGEAGRSTPPPPSRGSKVTPNCPGRPAPARRNHHPGTAHQPRPGRRRLRFGDPRQALPRPAGGSGPERRTGRFKEVDYYLPIRNAQGHAEEVRVDRRQRKTGWKTPPIPPAGAAGSLELRARDILLNEKTAAARPATWCSRSRTCQCSISRICRFPSPTSAIGFSVSRQGYGAQPASIWPFPTTGTSPEPRHDHLPRLMSERGVLLAWNTGFSNPGIRDNLISSTFQTTPLRGRAGSFNIRDRATPLPNFYHRFTLRVRLRCQLPADLTNNLDFLTDNYLERHLTPAITRITGRRWRGSRATRF